jgi:hypothetical protein
MLLTDFIPNSICLFLRVPAVAASALCKSKPSRSCTVSAVEVAKEAFT